ncbi:MAG: helix-turn-helix domain-containing protein [Peptococcaceae bacterium]|nr:helix-turn-helix domain-containing protein [Peptococcaceae bacterium]
MFKERLKIARKAKGLTQQGLADMIGINIETIRSYEQGKRRPDLNMLKKISKVLDCDANYLLDIKVKEKEGKVVFGEMAEIVDKLESLPEEQRKATIQLIRTLK